MRELLRRFQEPSTYAGLAAILVGFGVAIPPGIVENAAMIGGGIAGLVGVFAPEGKR